MVEPEEEAEMETKHTAGSQQTQKRGGIPSKEGSVDRNTQVWS